MVENKSYITLGRRKVGLGHPCFIVAEISGNHLQSYEKAVKLIRAAKRAGVDAVKFQTYTPDTITIDSSRRHFLVTGKKIPKIWKGENFYKLYQKTYTPWGWQPKLKRIVEDLGLIFFSTPFDETAVDFLEDMGVSCYKIASYEALDIPLLRKVAKTGKPIIISFGLFSKEENEFSVKTLREAGAEQIAILYCLSQYSEDPPIEQMNLATIGYMRDYFDVPCGLSDNNAGIEIPIIAASMGASIIEKHFILKRKSGGFDSRFSLEPQEMKQMVQSIRRAEKAKGRVFFGPAGSQAKEIKKFAPSIYALRDIEAGEILTERNIGTVRPGGGLSPRLWDSVIGKRTLRRIKFATPPSLKFIE